MKQIQPLLHNDFYKQSHYRMYPAGTQKVYSNLTARKSRVDGVQTVVLFGLQYFIKEYLMHQWQENFFNKPWEKVEAKYLRMINATLGKGAVDTAHIKKLHDLGYLPLRIKALPEGVSVSIRTPCVTITNTVDHAYWLVNYLESIWSCITWQPVTSATIAREFRKMLDKYALETVGDTSFVQWQGHDFSFRGMSSMESACTSGAGHLLAFTGTDTIPAIEFLENYYGANVDKELVGASVPASEHAVASFNIIFGSNDWRFGYGAMLKEFVERTPAGWEKPEPDDIDPKLIKEYAFLKWYITECVPNGVASYVGDTYNLFAVVAEILPRLKPEIMARTGGFPVDKLVIRPDSFWTDPVDCLCGFDGYHPQMEKLTAREKEVVRKGLIESLWDIFGGSTSTQGYKILDSHIGAIYGDSINKERGEKISIRLKNKGFASINCVYGIGSFTYQFNTRDTFGMAIKATYGIVNGTPIEVFKDPVSDDGMKKSAKGLIRVDLVNGHYTYTDCVSPEEEQKGELKTVFLDGKLLVDHTLADIRARVLA
jgi:nicotinamide phosphoribosyltransferase